MPLFLVRGPKGGLAIVTADSEMDAKLDTNDNCFGVDLGEVTVIELEIDQTKHNVQEINSFIDGRPVL
jgi:hypothetical protein